MIETKRLLLRELRAADDDALYAVLADADSMRHYPYRFDETRVRGWIAKNIERYRVFGFGLWAVVQKDSGELIGDCGLTMQDVNGFIKPEIGYHIRRDCQRRGYAREAAAAVRDWTFENTPFGAVCSYMKAANVGSSATARSVGMRKTEEFTDGENETSEVYAITRMEWEQLKQTERGQPPSPAVCAWDVTRKITKFTGEVQMKPNQYLIDFYGSYDEDARLAPRHGSVEFLTTMRYIARYIKPGDRVLEIGAGTGRYSHALARQGYAVDAVELVEHNIEVFRKNTLPDEKITVAQGNALDLSAFPDGGYDITLLLGPLYHLYTEADKRQALREAIRVTKPGGVIFAAYVISDGCLLDEGFRLGNVDVADYLGRGLLDRETFAAKSKPQDLFELVRKEDIDALMQAFPVRRLHYVAADGCALLLREALDAMNDDAFALYLDYHFATCERADLAGVSSHALDIFRK